MEEYLAQKYAHILDAEDIMELFENIKNVYGSIQKAAAKCDVARTTPYGWEQANYVKTITKIKVLKASLEANLIETLRVLTNKSKDRTGDLLLAYMTAIYQKAIDINQPEFEQILDRFLVTRQEHNGLIRDTLYDEVTLMTQTIAEKAMRLQINLPQDSIEHIEPLHILEIIPDIVWDLVMKRLDPIAITNKYGVPIEIPITIQGALEPIISGSTKLTTQPVTDVWIGYGKLKVAAGRTAVGFNRSGVFGAESSEEFKFIPVSR
jgi:hemerythrin superfamily protein